MPVITRNQSKKMTAIASLKPSIQHINPVTRVEQNVVRAYLDCESSFSSEIKNLLNDIELATGKLAKMKICLEIYIRINNQLENLLSVNQARWLKFAATAYNKTSEFVEDPVKNRYDEIDPELVTTFTNEYMKARQFLSSYFKKVRSLNTNIINLNDKLYADMFKNIDEEDLKSQRPRRNIPVVDYTGMDAIEPECEDDYITDIWMDKTIDCDSDYDPNEDDEEDEEDDEELLKKNSQHVTLRKKTSLLPLLLFTRKDDDEVMRKNMPNVTVRPKRKIPRVDYSGMDTNEDDKSGDEDLCEEY
jgi:hypothetical protein